MSLSVKQQQRLFKKYGPWALVTGATSGIGYELTLELAQAGFHLIINSRDSEALNRQADELSSRFPIQVTTAPADLSDEEGVKSLLSTTKTHEIGLVIASAGYGTSGVFHESKLEDELNMFDLNARSTLFLTHYFARRFAERGKGGIILMSSMVAFQGAPFAANYAATKAYVQTLVEGIALELKPYGVAILAAAPGPVMSGFGSRANMKMSMSISPKQVATPILTALGRKTTVLPGFLTKFLVYSMRTVPRWGRIRIMKMVMSGMTKHQLK
jgi:short-subunit dehydrogenase